MSTIQSKHEKCAKNEFFVGNITTRDKLLHLKGLKYRVGSMAYDIHGKELDEKRYRPLFMVGEDSYNKYNDIMMAQVRAIRRGF